VNKAIFQILYCSRNRLTGTPESLRAQIDGILRASRRNNAAAGVTGALFHNALCFAQVLEGPFLEVQRVFERLQLDPRHAELVVLRSGYTAERAFDGWSMAHVPEREVDLTSLDQGALSRLTSEDGTEILSFLRGVVGRQRHEPRAQAVRPLLEQVG
jgi:hypothetical protein